MEGSTQYAVSAPESPPIQSADELKDAILASLSDGKADDIVVIPLAGKSDMADYMVVATGRSNRHVMSLADGLAKALKHANVPVSVEGQQQGDWVLVDTFDIVVHLFRQEVRETYNLEKMWKMELP